MRLIDADAIRLKQGFFEEVDNVPKFYDWLDEQPTVDAVPVVRCKNCAKRGTLNCDLDYCGYRRSDNWYCADGEGLETDASIND